MIILRLKSLKRWSRNWISLFNQNNSKKSGAGVRISLDIGPLPMLQSSVEKIFKTIQRYRQDGHMKSLGLVLP